MSRIITLTTDFGTASPYVAVMKGVILTINAAACIHDLSHAIPPQNIGHAAHFLSGSVPYFPTGTIHVCVVDPGVGTERAALLAEVGGQFLIAPDNGCLSLALDQLRKPIVRRLAEPKFWRADVSATFHGRDVFAPVAAHLSLGVKPAEFGPVMHEWVKSEPPKPRREKNSIVGEVTFIDEFGNLITNISAEIVHKPPQDLRLGAVQRKRFRWVRSYAEAEPGTLIALISSDGWLEIAVVNGSAARRLRARVGMPVTIAFVR